MMGLNLIGLALKVLLYFCVMKHGLTFYGACSCVVVKALYYKPEGRRFETLWGELIFSIYLILPVALGPGIYSASNRNEYQKQKK
jgi:hypothetical protein